SRRPRRTSRRRGRRSPRARAPAAPCPARRRSRRSARAGHWQRSPRPGLRSARASPRPSPSGFRWNRSFVLLFPALLLTTLALGQARCQVGGLVRAAIVSGSLVLGRGLFGVLAFVARLLRLLLAQLLRCPIVVVVRHHDGGSSTIPRAEPMPETSITRSTSL